MDFKTYLVQKGLKPRTVFYYTKHFSLLEKKGALSYDGFLVFSSALLQQSKKGSYLNKLRETLKSYHKYLQSEGLPFEQKSIDFPKYKEVPPIKSTLSDEEIEAFLTLPPTRHGKKETANYARWTFFYQILSLTGLRCGELASLKAENVDFGISCFQILDDKTGHNRLVPIPPNMLTEVSDYCRGLQGYLFPSLRGGNNNGLGAVVDNVDWHYNFHSRLKRLGIKRPGLTPYSLRHSFITRLLEEDVNIFKVQKIVGHRRLETTAGYTHLTTKDIQKAVTKLPRIAKELDPKIKILALKNTIDSMEFENDTRLTYVSEFSGSKLKFEVTLKELAEMQPD